MLYLLKKQYRVQVNPHIWVWEDKPVPCERCNDRKLVLDEDEQVIPCPDCTEGN